MKRIIGAAFGLLLAFVLLVPAVAAADPTTAHTGRVLISTEGDVTVAAGDQYDAVVVVNGNATIFGEVNTVVVVDGTLSMTGALAETVVAIRTPVTLGPGTVVRNDLYKLDALVTKQGDGDVAGEIKDIGSQIAGLGFVLAPLFILLFIGFAVAAVAAGLLVAALGARQVRVAEELITRRPVEVFVTGLVGAIVPIFILAGLFISVVGIPLAFGILFVAWPLVAFLGYIVAGIWIGDWILARLYPGTVRERPYLASVVGLVVLALFGLFPPLTAIASLFGYGAVVMLAWQTFRHHGLAGSAAPTWTASPNPV
jgi:hypothetical protein